MDNISTTKRIAKNTLMLYLRQILIMLVSLYSVRVVLNVLGAEDYGVYNVVAGVVTMFGFVSTTMANASQRFFSFELGQNNFEKLKRTFRVTVSIYLFIILLVLLLAETVGLWFVKNKLVISNNRLNAARFVYQTSIISFVITLVTAPYMASIIAHENMNVYAYISIVEAVLKLVIVFLLQIIKFDKLIVYGILLLSVNFINTGLYRFYCKKHYKECVFKPLWDKNLFFEIFGYTGWSIFGAFTTVARTQALTVLINQFFNPVVVAARTISGNVTYTVKTFSNNFNTSLYAPIVKEYASGNKKGAFDLVYDGCKITFFLMWIFTLPLVLRMEYVLTLWLKNLPEFVVIFTQLSLIEVLINSVSLPIMTLARAHGKVKLYELVLGILQLFIFITSWIAVGVFHCDAIVIFYISIIFIAIMLVARLFIVKILVDFSIKVFFIRVFLPILLVSIISIIPSYFLNNVLPQNFISLCIIVFISLFLSSISMFYIGLGKDMRIKISTKIKSKFGRVKNV